MTIRAIPPSVLLLSAVRKPSDLQRISIVIGLEGLFKYLSRCPITHMAN